MQLSLDDDQYFRGVVILPRTRYNFADHRGLPCCFLWPATVIQYCPFVSGAWEFGGARVCGFMLVGVTRLGA